MKIPTIQAATPVTITLTIRDSDGNILTLSSYVTKSIKCTSKTDTVTVSADFVTTNGTDGKIRAIFDHTAFVDDGMWYAQGILDGNYTSKVKFYVEANI